MPAAAIPRHEARRLAAVQALRMMGTPAEERFDKIARLAKRVFNVPFAFIDFVGEHRVWIKSALGVDISEAPIGPSYCTHTVLADGLCLIEDARTDPRTSDNQYAKDFVFYAGAPIRFEGQAVGAICVCDSAPRTLSDEESALLQDLASMVDQELCVAALSEAQLALAKENEDLATKALVDPLTRLWNRGAIAELGARELESASRDGISTGFVLFDLDHFKKINDTHGHAAGDEVLRRVSDRIRRAIRSFDAAGRWGGEEFLVVLPTCSESHVVSAAERIRLDICAEPIEFNGVEIPVSASFGCSVSADGRAFVAHLVRAADDALYRAKAEGRNRTHFKRVTPSVMAMKAVKE